MSNRVVRSFRVAKRGSSDPCPHCALTQSNQHTLRQSSLCDSVRKGLITQDEAKMLYNNKRGVRN
jgi:hypothetical protein